MILRQKTMKYAMFKNFGKNHLDLKFSDSFKIFFFFKWGVSMNFELTGKIVQNPIVLYE